MNYLHIDTIQNIKTVIKCKTNIISIDASFCENLFNLKGYSILFRRIKKDNASFLIQDINGWLYSISEEKFNYISRYCLENNDLEIINEIDYTKTSNEQQNISGIHISPLLKKQYYSEEDLPPIFEKIELPERFKNSNILMTDTHRNHDGDNFVSLRTILISLKLNDNLNMYSHHNYFNYNKNTLNIEKKYTFVQAEDIKNTFKLDENKSIGYINSNNGLSIIESSFKYSPSSEVFDKLYHFMNDYEGYTAYIEIEKTSNIDYRVSAVYVRLRSYSWARIPSENFENHEILITT
jgi:hypothetical protein